MRKYNTKNIKLKKPRYGTVSYRLTTTQDISERAQLSGTVTKSMTVGPKYHSIQEKARAPDYNTVSCKEYLMVVRLICVEQFCDFPRATLDLKINKSFFTNLGTSIFA